MTNHTPPRDAQTATHAAKTAPVAVEGAPEWHLSKLLGFICPDPKHLRGLKDDDGLHMEVHLRVGDVRAAHSVLSRFGSAEPAPVAAKDRKAILQEMADLDQQEGLLDLTSTRADLRDETEMEHTAETAPVAVEVHTYSPDPMLMGDCQICGHTRDAHADLAPTDNTALVEAATRWAKLKKENDERRWLGGWNNDEQGAALTKARQDMEEAALQPAAPPPTLDLKAKIMAMRLDDDCPPEKDPGFDAGLYAAADLVAIHAAETAPVAVEVHTYSPDPMLMDDCQICGHTRDAHADLAPTGNTALVEVVAFLCGDGPLEGVHFGDQHPTERGAFWWRKKLRAALSQPAAPQPTPEVEAWRDVLKERQRQVAVEGRTAREDDAYQSGDLAAAAACYAWPRYFMGNPRPDGWPWAMSWWKPTDRRRDLVKAGALILAEIERIDRAALAQTAPEQGGHHG